MLRRVLVLGGAAVLVGAMAAPAAAGSHHKTVISVDDAYSYDCTTLEFGPPGAGDVDAVVDGKIQAFAPKGKGGKTFELTVFHLNVTFTNAEGDTWVWRDRGPDKLIDVDGDGEPDYVAITGRTGLNNIGHMVIDLSTGEIVHQAGRSPFGGEPFERFPEDYACDLLVG